MGQPQKPFMPWTCPDCGTVYKLPAGRKPPVSCPQCRRAQLAEQAALQEFLAETEEARARAAEERKPTGTAADPDHFQPAPTMLPENFVRVVEAPQPRTFGYRLGTWSRRNPWRAAVVAVSPLLAIMIWLAVQHGKPDLPPVAAEAPKPPQDMSDREIYLISTSLVRKTLLAGETAKFSPDHLVKRDYKFGDRMEAVTVGGTGQSQNKFGQWQDFTWEVDGHADHKDGSLKANTIKLNGILAYTDPEWGEALKAMMYAGGNEWSDLTEEIKAEIRRVIATIEEAVGRQIGTPTFTLEWPNDPGRHEPKVHIDLTKEWHVLGKIRRYDTTRRDELEANVSRHTGEMIRLRIGKRWVIGGPPE